MLLSYYIYIILPLFLFAYFLFANRIFSHICIVKYSLNFNIANSFIIYSIPILLLSIILGLRYDVGTDYFSYAEIYNMQYDNLYENILYDRIEPLYMIVNHIPFAFNMPYYYLNIIVCLIIFSLFYAAFYKEKNMIMWYFLTLFTSGVLFSFLNIQRHAIAFCIFLFSIKYIYSRSFIKYLICVILAFGFHYSSFILLPCYLLGVKRRIMVDNRLVQIVMCVCLFLFAGQIVSLLVDLIINYAPKGYSGYGEQVFSLQIGASKRGIIASFITSLCVIMSSKYLLKQYDETIFVVYYRLCFIGLIFSSIFSDYILLSRMIYPFVCLNFIIYAYLYKYIFLNFRKCNAPMMIYSIIIFLSSVLSFLLLISNSVHKCSPFKFVDL